MSLRLLVPRARRLFGALSLLLAVAPSAACGGESYPLIEQPPAPTGPCAWSKSLGGPGLEALSRGAVSQLGDIAVALSYDTNTVVDGTAFSIDEPPGHAMIVLGANGERRWAANIGAPHVPRPAADYAVRPSFSAEGSIVVTAHDFPMDYGDLPLDPTSFAKLSLDGRVQAQQTFLSFLDTANRVADSAVDPLGRLYALISSETEFPFQDQNIPAGSALIMMLDADGGDRGVLRLGSWWNRGSISVAADGTVAVAGVLDIERTAKILALRPDGTTRFSKTLGVPPDVELSSVVIDASGKIVVTGHVTGIQDLGGGPIGAPFIGTMFALALSYDGAFLWQRELGDAGAPNAAGRAIAIAVGPEGDLALAGTYAGAFDAGEGPVKARSVSDLFVVALRTDGEVAWSRTYEGPVASLSLDVGIGAGFVVVMGTHLGELDLGCGPMPTTPYGNVFVASLRP